MSAQWLQLAERTGLDTQLYKLVVNNPNAQMAHYEQQRPTLPHPAFLRSIGITHLLWVWRSTEAGGCSEGSTGGTPIDRLDKQAG